MTATPASRAAATNRSTSATNISSLAACTNIGGRPARSAYRGETSGRRPHGEAIDALNAAAEALTTAVGAADAVNDAAAAVTAAVGDIEAAAAALTEAVGDADAAKSSRLGMRNLQRVMGMLRPRRGTVTLRGSPVHELPSFRVAQAGIGLVPEGRPSIDDRINSFSHFVTKDVRAALDESAEYVPAVSVSPVTHWYLRMPSSASSRETFGRRVRMASITLLRRAR